MKIDKNISNNWAIMCVHLILIIASAQRGNLLDAQTALSESKLYLLKSNIDCEVNMIKLRIAMGEQL
jgi:hypothetical protein